jgi:tetratricopeptide (TPR) repeat protein
VDRFATMTRTAGAGRPRSVESDMALGRRFGAGSVLTGTVARAGDAVRIEATLLRSDRPVPLARASAVAPAESVAVLTDSLTLQLVRQVWLERAPPTPSLAAVTTRSVPALRSFLDGERAMLAGRWREAGDDYRVAFTADSAFTLAYARYAEAVTWRRDDHVYEADPDVRRRLRAGRLALPERDRLLVDARLAADSVPSTRLRLLEEVTRRYSDYWPGWLAYGDALVHFGLLHGRGWAEARAALRRSLDASPEIVSAWEHLGWTSAAYDTAAFRESVEQRVRLGYYAGPRGAAGLRADRLLSGLGHDGGQVTPGLRPLADSVARDRAALAFEPFRWSVLRELGFGFPAAQIDLDRRVLSEALSPEARGEAVRSLALAWATRGAWDSALADADRFVKLGVNPSAASHAYSLAVIGAWLGAIDPAEAVRRGTVAAAALPRLPDEARPIRRLCLYWLDGVVAFIRHDRAALAEATTALRGLRTRAGDTNAGILAAFALALDGRRAEAGRRLAAIEWEAADWAGDDLSRYDLLLTRLTAARWLAEAGDSDQALRLLRAADAIGAGKVADTYVLAGPAHLAAARLLEARGDTAGALEGYRQLLRRLDLPSPPLQPMADEARRGLSRLGGRPVS